MAFAKQLAYRAEVAKVAKQLASATLANCLASSINCLALTLLPLAI